MGWVGNNSWMDSPFFRDIWSHKTSETLFSFVIFSILGRSRKNQCSRHFSKKSIPGLFYLEPHRKVNATTLELFTTNFKNLKQNRPTSFQTLIFLWNLGFQQPGICPRQPPGGVIFPEMIPQQIFSDNIGQPSKSSFFDKMALFVLFFLAPIGRAL